MKILRTDSGGESTTNERLMLLRKMLIYIDIKHIYKLHDHKGILTVYWETQPTQNQMKKVSEAWEFFFEFEIEHKLVNLIDL